MGIIHFMPVVLGVNILLILIRIKLRSSDAI